MQRHSVLLCMGLSLVVLGVTFLCCWTGLYNYIITKEMPLGRSSILYQYWRVSHIPVSLSIYLFNCTNSDKMMERDFKPELVQLGPYKFTEKHEKVNITWNANHTVTYRLVQKFYYDEENSNGSLHDKFITLDPAALAVSHVSRHWNFISTLPLSAALQVLGKSVWMTKSVGEYLVDGYTEPLMTMANMIPWSLTSSSLSGTKSDKLGLFVERNGSAMAEGVMNVNTGEEDLSNMGRIHYHNYVNQSKVFGAECGQIKGSVGEFFGTMLTREKHLDVFFVDLCRALQFDYVEDSTVNGVDGYRYEMRKTVLDNGTTDPSTRCNCAGTCLPQGVFNMSACVQNIPLYLSYPHFLYADPHYRHQVNGMHPDRVLHNLDVTVEPTTGIPLDACFRLQYNLLLIPNSKISLYQDVPTLMVPTMWVERRYTLPRKFAMYINLVISLPTIGLYFFAGVLLLGITLLASSYTQKIFECKREHRKERRHPFEQAKQEDSTGAEAQNDKKLQITTPEENLLLNSERETALSSD